MNRSWIPSSISLSTFKALTNFSFESCSASRRRFDAIFVHSVRLLPRCGVPRKIISLVRKRQASDLRNAYKPKSISHKVRALELSHFHTSLTTIPPRLCATNMTGSCFRQPGSAHPKLNSAFYFIFNFPFKLYLKITAVLGHIILVVSRKYVTNHIGIVSVCPYSCLWNIVCEVVFGPKYHF